MAEDDRKTRPKDRWDKFRIAAQAVGVALIPVAIAFATVWIDAGIRNRQVDLEMVRLAVGILQEDPEETGLMALREWSMDAIDAYSGIPLPASAREELRNQPLPIGWRTRDRDTYSSGRSTRGTLDPMQEGSGTYPLDDVMR